ncbi:MAG: TonB-dependent receptor [Elusimicrobiota bacterium]
MINKIFLITFYFILTGAVNALSHIELPDLIVVGSRSGVESGRDIEILNKSDFSDMYAAPLDSIINNFSSIYIMNRGPSGIQQDIGICAGSAAQSLIMLDGIPVNDPQTEHFNMNLPVSPGAVKRIELMKGHGSVSHGSGAMGGVINIVSDTSGEKDSLTVYGGDFETCGGEIVLNRDFGGYSNMFSFAARNTGNYHPQTDSSNISFFDSMNYGDLKVSAGYMNKEFGAFDFYTPGWGMPSREWNETIIISGSGRKEISGMILRPSVMWRRHIDRFVLNADMPEFYENNHTNDILSGMLETRYGGLLIGIDTKGEYLDSSSMGIHNRCILSCFTEYTLRPAPDIVISGGIRKEGIVVPRVSAGWWISERIKLRASWGGSYRRPTFTELYYNSPANKGNIELCPEKGEDVEVGADIAITAAVEMSITCGIRKRSDLIDWVGQSANGPWQAENRGSGINDTVNMNIGGRSGALVYKLGYFFADIANDDTYYSKYSLKYLRHRINFMIKMHMGNHLTVITSGEWAVPEGREEEDFSRIDAGISKKLAATDIFIRVENIFNSQYSDFSSVPSPGRWAVAGVRW